MKESGHSVNMWFLRFRMAILALCFSGGASLASAALEFTGVNLAGAEFTPAALPGRYGTDYIYPDPASVDYYIGKDMNLVRLPFLWERLQRTLNAPFDATELGRLDHFVSQTTAKGVSVILDPHNYARYRGNIVGSAALPHSAFADFWERLAERYKDNSLVIFGLMNEPHDMATETWLTAANAAIAAIRETGAKNLILVPGNAWTGAHSWLQSWYGTANGTVMRGVVDPADNFAFDMHQYLDGDASGTVSTTVDATIGSRRLAAATGWLRTHGYRALLGEFGGYTDATALAALDDMLDYMKANSDVWMGWTYWAGGPWWDDYIFTLEPNPSGNDRPQMAVLFPHTQVRVPSQSLSFSGMASFQSQAGYFYQLWIGDSPANLSESGRRMMGTGSSIDFPVPEVAGKDRFFIRLGVTKE